MFSFCISDFIFLLINKEKKWQITIRKKVSEIYFVIFTVFQRFEIDAWKKKILILI